MQVVAMYGMDRSTIEIHHATVLGPKSIFYHKFQFIVGDNIEF